VVFHIGWARGFPRYPLFLSAEFLFLDIPRTACSNRAIACLQKISKILKTQFTPLVFCTLISNRVQEDCYLHIFKDANQAMNGTTWLGHSIIQPVNCDRSSYLCFSSVLYEENLSEML